MPHLLTLPHTAALHRPALVKTLSLIRDDGDHSTLIVVVSTPSEGASDSIPFDNIPPENTSDNRHSVFGNTSPNNIPWYRAQAALARFYTLVASALNELGMPFEADKVAGGINVVGVFKRMRRKWEREFWVEGGALLEVTQGEEGTEGTVIELFKEYDEDEDAKLEEKDVVSKGNGKKCGMLKSVCLGGAFDHLHLGHKLLLSAAALLVDMSDTIVVAPHYNTLTIGISADAVLAKKAYSEYVQRWTDRARAIMWFFVEFLGIFGAFSDFGLSGDIGCTKDVTENTSTENTAEITTESIAEITTESTTENATLTLTSHVPPLIIRFVEITDAYGPTITEKDMQALVVSHETLGGGEAVNARRRERGWDGLDMYVVDVLGGDGGDGWKGKISSTDIRRGRRAS